MSENLSSSQAEVQATLEKNLKERFSDKIDFLKPHAWKGYGLTCSVKSEFAFDFFKELRDSDTFDFDYLVDVTAVDWMDKREPRFDVVYQLMSIAKNHRLSVKIQVDEDKPSVASVRPLWPAANFMEREVWDMYGIKFDGHGDLRRILLYDEFEGHPLRKDYPIKKKQPRIKLRVPELRNTAVDMQRNELVALPSRKQQANS